MHASAIKTMRLVRRASASFAPLDRVELMEALRSGLRFVECIQAVSVLEWAAVFPL